MLLDGALTIFKRWVEGGLVGELTGSSRCCGLLTGAGLEVAVTVYFFVGFGRLIDAAKRLGSWASDVSLDTFGFQVRFADEPKSPMMELGEVIMVR